MKKVLCIILAVMMLSTMSLTAFANGYTTTVTYDIATGKATLSTSGTADKGSEVTHIVYKNGNATNKDNILYVDQQTANATTGAFDFDFSIAADKMAGIATATSVVGTDGAAINADNGADSDAISDVAGYTAVTVNVAGDITATVTAADATTNTTTVTVNSSAAKTVYVKTGSTASFALTGATGYTYSLNGDASVKTDSATVAPTFSGTTATISFAAYVEPAVDANTASFNNIITDEAGPASVTDWTKPNDLTVADGYTDILADVESGRYFLLTGTRAKKVENLVEYGILLKVNAYQSTDIKAGDEGVHILPVLGANSEGEFIIKVVDSSNTMDDIVVRAYAKNANGDYLYSDHEYKAGYVESQN